MPELNFNVLARQGPKGVLQGFEQGQEFRNQMLRQEQQREAGDLAIKLDKAKFDEYENDRKELAQLKEQLKGQGLTPESYAEVLTNSGIPQYVEMGMKAKQKLQEIAQYNKIMGYSDETAPAASQAGAVPSVVRVPQQAPAAPVNALGSGMYGMEQPVAPAAPANAMVAPRVPAAPMGNVVAAQFGPEQIASISDRIEKLTALGTPQALQTAGMLQRQLEMMSKQKPPTQYMAVGNNIFNAETGQFVKNPYATAPAATGGSGAAATTAASAGDEALIAQAIRDGRLDLSQVTSKNKSVIASTLKSNPAHDFRTSGVEFMGAKAGSRTLGTSEAKMVQAASEATEMMNITRQLIPTINPTDYPLLNQAGNYVARNSGNPAQVGFATALNGLVNTYARAINPTGVPTVSDKQHAREVINSAMSSGQLNEALRVMQLEMDAALASPAKARKALGHTKEAEVPGERKPAQAAPAVSADEKAQALSWAKANRSDPRAAKILQMYGEK